MIGGQGGSVERDVMLEKVRGLKVGCGGYRRAVVGYLNIRRYEAIEGVWRMWSSKGLCGSIG